MAGDTEINVKVTATTDDLASGLKTASNQVETFGDGINDLAQRVATVKPDAFKELAQAFNQGKLDLDEFRDGLIATTAAQSAAATEATALATSTHVSSMAMREFVVAGRELASGNLTRLPGTLSILASRFLGIQPAAILAVAGVAAFGYALYEVINSSQQFEKELTDIQIGMQASGRGGSYSESFVTGLIDNLRQASDVTRDQAAEIVRSFESVRNLSQADIETIVGNLTRYKTAVHETSEQAAKDLAKAFGGDTLGFIDELSKKFGIYSAAQLESARAAKEVGDQAALTKIALQGLDEVANKTEGENLTGLAKYWNDVKLSLSGVSVEAEHARNALLAAADAANKVGDKDSADKFRYQASGYESRTRNLPAYTPSAPAQSAGQTIDSTPQAEQQKQIANSTDAVKKLNDEYVKSNAPLAEQERHLQTIGKYQDQIAAAQALHDAASVQRGQELIDAENKRYANQLKSQDRPETRTDDAQIKAASEGAAARIKTEEDFVRDKERLGEISTADAIKQLNSLAAQEHEINLKRIADMRAVYAKNGDQAGLASSAGDQEKEDARYQDEQNKLNTEAAEAEQRLNEQKIEGAAKVAEARIKTAEEVAKQEYELGKISADEQLATLTDLAKQTSDIEQKKFDQLAALYASDSAKYAQYQQQKEEAQEKLTQQLNALNEKATKENQDMLQKEQQQYDQTAQKVLTPWENALTQMTTGTTRWQQAVNRAGQSVENEFVNNIVKGIVNSWILGENTKTSATLVGNAARTASDTSAAGAGGSAAADADKTTIMNNAATTASNVYNNVSQIPYVGWALAPAAAAAAFAAVAGFGMQIQVPSAAGGMVVPNDTLAMVHKNEMILPAHLSQGIAGMIAGGQGGGGGGHTFNTTVNANGRLNASDLDGLHDAVVSTMKKAARNGAFGSMRAA